PRGPHGRRDRRADRCARQHRALAPAPRARGSRRGRAPPPGGAVSDLPPELRALFDAERRAAVAPPAVRAAVRAKVSSSAASTTVGAIARKLLSVLLALGVGGA